MFFAPGAANGEDENGEASPDTFTDEERGGINRREGEDEKRLVEESAVDKDGRRAEIGMAKGSLDGFNPDGPEKFEDE